MALCQDCMRRNECKSICQDVKKEIIGRGRTASRKPKTYPVNFSHIEDTHQTLNPFQKAVLKTITKLTFDVREELFTKLELEEAMDKSLNGREKEVIVFFMQDYKQKEIAQKLNISQPRINFLLQRALKKLKIYLGQL